MLPRLAYLGITNAFAMLRLVPGSDHDKDVEILSLRHQLAVLQRQLDGQRVRFEPIDRAWVAALLHRLPRSTLRGLQLLVRPDTILKLHRDLIARRHAAASRKPRGRPLPCARSAPWFAPGEGEHRLGLSACARRAVDARDHRCAVNGVGDAARGRD